MTKPAVRRRLQAALLLVGFGMMGAAPMQDTLTSMVTDTRLGAAPLTVALQPQPALAVATRAGTDVIIALAVEAIAGNVVQPVRINVFIDKPGADHATPTDDPSCVGFIQLMPSRGTVHAVSHAFELTQVAGLDPSRPIRVTLVPVVGTDDVPHDISLQVGRIYLRREQ